jgi:hypothetical protein
MTEFVALVGSLPATIPEGKDGDALAVFGGDPSVHLVLGMRNDELWEDVINPMLDRVFSGRHRDNWEEVVRRGEKGLGGFCAFVSFWIRKGVESILFEPRIENLTEAINQ